MTRPILIVEDDPDISESLKYNFEREGLTAITALTGEAGLAAALNERESPSLIILDLMLPGMSGTELCRRLRREPATRRTPIIMLTAKASESDRVAGLDLGADDYITKPFSVRELLARVRAVMRRMSDHALRMLRAALDAFTSGDAAAAREVILSDAEINELYNHVFHRLIEMMVTEPTTATRDARLLFVAKHLERIGDYVTDICELTVYMAEAAFIKHFK